MCPYPWYQVMRLSKDKKQQRHQMVMHAKEHGVKPAARRYATGPKTVRKWLLRFIEGGYQALDDLPEKPHVSPGAIPETRAKKIVALKSVYKRLGADQVKMGNVPGTLYSRGHFQLGQCTRYSLSLLRIAENPRWGHFQLGQCTRYSLSLPPVYSPSRGFFGLLRWRNLGGPS